MRRSWSRRRRRLSPWGSGVGRQCRRRRRCAAWRSGADGRTGPRVGARGVQLIAQLARSRGSPVRVRLQRLQPGRRRCQLQPPNAASSHTVDMCISPRVGVRGVNSIATSAASPGSPVVVVVGLQRRSLRQLQPQGREDIAASSHTADGCISPRLGARGVQPIATRARSPGSPATTTTTTTTSLQRRSLRQAVVGLQAHAHAHAHVQYRRRRQTTRRPQRTGGASRKRVGLAAIAGRLAQ